MIRRLFKKMRRRRIAAYCRACKAGTASAPLRVTVGRGVRREAIDKEGLESGRFGEPGEPGQKVICDLNEAFTFCDPLWLTELYIAVNEQIRDEMKRESVTLRILRNEKDVVASGCAEAARKLGF